MRIVFNSLVENILLVKALFMRHDLKLTNLVPHVIICDSNIFLLRDCEQHTGKVKVID